MTTEIVDLAQKILSRKPYAALDFEQSNFMMEKFMVEKNKKKKHLCKQVAPKIYSKPELRPTRDRLFLLEKRRKAMKKRVQALIKDLESMKDKSEDNVKLLEEAKLLLKESE